jgi:ABC-type multidrug transport system permease subunit
MALRALVKKEFRLLFRDRLSAGILLLMPLLCIAVLGLLLGEGFGQKTDNRLRVSLVDQDQGHPFREYREYASHLMITPTSAFGSLPAAAVQASAVHDRIQALEPWSRVVQRDLIESDIRVELIGSVEEAERLVHAGDRPAVLVLGPKFSERVHVCSFLNDGRNPFYREGVDIDVLDARLLRDPTAQTASAIIEQVCQVTLLRVILPWMIGRAFERLSEPSFIDLLGENVHLPVPGQFAFILNRLRKKPKPGEKRDENRISLQEMLDIAAGPDKNLAAEFRQKVGAGVKDALARQFSKYDLTGTTWANLTRSKQPPRGKGTGPARYVNEAGSGLLNRGAARYQILVPSYTVLFCFALVLTVGWLFVTERRQGTLRRMRASPVTRGEVLLGKLLPCLALSIFQGFFLLLAGKVVFAMSWGPPSWPVGKQLLMLAPVVASTSLAAMGLAMLVAAVARTEMQVAIVGSLLFLFLGLISGCLIPRELMPEAMTEVSHITPHAWALDAYRQLLMRQSAGVELVPNLEIVTRSCLVLSAFGIGFLALAWWFLRLD